MLYKKLVIYVLYFDHFSQSVLFRNGDISNAECVSIQIKNEN